VNSINETKYKESIDDAKKFLKGNTKKIEKKLGAKMLSASKNQMFEEAGRLRDRIKSINQIQKYQSVYIKEMRNIDIFAIKIVDNKSCIHGKFYRNGSNYGNKSFFPSHDNETEEVEILESFLYQFYADKDVPPKILVNIEEKFFKEVEITLNKKNKLKTKILKPKSGEKLQHILLAEKNALESIKLKKTSLEAHHSALNSLSQLLDIDYEINRVEAYDNSHTSGGNSVGVMVVADKEGLSPKHYRKFNIRYDMKDKKIASVDDYYMMEEVLSRRLSKINQTNEPSVPDVIIIDGGRGQYNSVLKIIKKYQLEDIKLLSVSKGPERNVGREIVHLENKNINLKPNDVLLNFIQRLRDEAHRFAITAHRSRRSKASIKSVFDEIKGIGPKRKKDLLLHFGTIKKIKSASLEELKKIKTIPLKKLEELYEFFNS
jgi:excinuclease ABC subunit C